MKEISDGLYKTVMCLMILLITSAGELHAGSFSELETKDVQVYFAPGQALAAEEAARIYPAVRSELEMRLTWRVDFRPSVLLAPDSRSFADMTGNGLVVAYAVPEKMLIVIDHSRVNTRPFSLFSTLEHEMCHLLLHRHIQPENLPRWLDEGVCQWASGGLDELAAGNSGQDLGWAAFSGALIPLSGLTSDFPYDERSMALAYQESRSIVEYIISGYGERGLLNILNALKDGIGLDDAVKIVTGMPVMELEKKWKGSQKSWTAFMSTLVANLYTVLFIIGAMLTVAVYIRLVIRKRRMTDEEE